MHRSTNEAPATLATTRIRDFMARGFLRRSAAMTGQLPEPGAGFLDHVAHFVPAMDAAAAALERCGFRLTPFTAQTNQVEGKSLPAGTGNPCAMFRRGQVETPASTGDTA